MAYMLSAAARTQLPVTVVPLQNLQICVFAVAFCQDVVFAPSATAAARAKLTAAALTDCERFSGTRMRAAACFLIAQFV